MDLEHLVMQSEYILSSPHYHLPHDPQDPHHHNQNEDPEKKLSSSLDEPGTGGYITLRLISTSPDISAVSATCIGLVTYMAASSSRA
jgi:hypothetical protein